MSAMSCVRIVLIWMGYVLLRGRETRRRLRMQLSKSRLVECHHGENSCMLWWNKKATGVEDFHNFWYSDFKRLKCGTFGECTIIALCRWAVEIVHNTLYRQILSFWFFVKHCFASMLSWCYVICCRRWCIQVLTHSPHLDRSQSRKEQFNQFSQTSDKATSFGSIHTVGKV